MKPIVPVSKKNVRTMRPERNESHLLEFEYSSEYSLTSVAKVKHRGNELANFKLNEEVKDAIEENVDGAST